MLLTKTQHRRHFSSGIRPILRALADIRDKEDANAVNKLLNEPAPPASNKQEQTDKSQSGEDAGEKKDLPLVLKAELERRKPKPSKKNAPSPVPAWKSRGRWACMKGCGACCYLDKGPQYPAVEEVLTNPEEASLYRSMIGKDGWCKNFDKSSRMCRIYKDRPRFCRVEPEVFLDLFDIPEHKFEKEACSLCRDSISDVYGCKSRELKSFERLLTSLKLGGKPS
ncbi:hypothetical protein KP509_35G024300 [Ceratopteris richardii]|uniref:Uncharacterized protein n=1 Tax=Ceratopteris richardii TaxID=49495 RepID=A0A8T2QGL7_CERRI|nr:hypothetical protein KP509_35G024300 [Ceratopteris richardii]